jgi:hypothetical protein
MTRKLERKGREKESEREREGGRERIINPLKTWSLTKFV